MKLFGVYGVSGFGREVMPLARSTVERLARSDRSELVFVDDSCTEKLINGHRAISFDEYMATSAESRSICIAIASSLVRQKLADKCAANDVDFFSITAPNAVVLDGNEIGEGSILCSFVNVTSNARIGRHFHANIYSYVAHDCVIGDFVTFAPGVQCNGNVRIDDHAYVGTGAVLKQGKPGEPLVIGAGAIVGMGAVVTRSVEAGITVVGNPARPLEVRGK